MAQFLEYEYTKPAILIKASLDLIHEPGEVFEVRIPKTRAGTISGYFNDTSKAATFIVKENGKNQAIYATVNPVQPALLARNENKFEYGSNTTTVDSDIVKRRWFLLDFDAIRPSGISSTDGELFLARECASSCIEWLRSIGWPEPIIAESGNGVHAMYRVDEPNDDTARVDFEFATKMISSIFSTDRVIVDTVCFNASRVWKIYGTVSAKGSSTEDRPHRVAKLVRAPKQMVLLTREQLEAVARPLRDAKSDEYKDMTGEFIQDMTKWLSDRGLTVSSGPRPMFGSEGQKWTITRCPFNHEHQNPMVGLVNNRPVFRCLHNSCASFRWKEFREKIDPTYKDPETVYLRMMDWCNTESDTIDGELAQSIAATGKKLPSLMKRLKADVPRPRYLVMEEIVKEQRKKYVREVLGENNEKGNIVGLINRTRTYQQEGIVPMFWIVEYDYKVRVGPVGDVDCPRLSGEDEIKLLVKFHSSGDSWVKQVHCAQVIQYLASEYRVNPLRQWLKAKTWDGIPRLTNWLHTYMGTKDNEYTRAVGRKWLISAVARGIEPGCQADHMLIFEGKQGIGKSQALRILGGQFYAEYSGSVHTTTGIRDIVAVITGKLIIEMSELVSLRRADMESLKAMLTTPVDEARLAYERDAKSYPRTCVFGGTTNEVGNSYIADVTGARRFWPVLCAEMHPIRSAKLKEDVDQLWAEAVEAYENGEDWWTIPADLASHEQTERQMTVENSDPWFERIRASLTDPESYSNDVFFTTPEYMDGQLVEGSFVVRAGSFNTILAVALGVEISRQGTADVIRLQRIMRHIGFVKTRPSKKWLGGAYAYDLKRAVLPHLWSSIDEARKSVKFPKQSNENQNQGPDF
jgi:hypothetical protein